MGNSVIARIVGGLGNQLFIYAATRRLSLRNNVPLKLDITSGFRIDPYNRKYSLNHFNIKSRIASPFESYKGVSGILRRKIDRFYSNQKDFGERSYLEQESKEFDVRVLNYNIINTLYIEGYWQSEKYFIDIADFIRKEFTINTPLNEKIIEVENKIRNTNSVCLHARRFDYDKINTNAHKYTLGPDYYEKAISILKTKIDNPVFFCFGDEPEWLIQNINNIENSYVVKNNNDFEDLWLMSQCRHFIISNSTFAWWGAWLNENPNKIVFTPDSIIYALNRDYYPKDWITIR
jgi:hypothetical protein